MHLTLNQGTGFEPLAAHVKGVAMMTRSIAWLDSWRETLTIKYRYPELYRHLTEPLDPADFMEVGPPQ
jgi:hypothetical protein